jgi:hypothetical protein
VAKLANSNIASVGRFSSQMLTYFGTQKTVKNVGGAYQNTFKYASGPTTFTNAGSLLQSELGSGVVGNFSPSAYDSTKSYFLSRGVGTAYAETMTALAIDIAGTLGISPQVLLEQSEVSSKLVLSDNAYKLFNNFRDTTHQVGVVTSVSNKTSLQARAIRS